MRLLVTELMYKLVGLNKRLSSLISRNSVAPSLDVVQYLPSGIEITDEPNTKLELNTIFEPEI